MRYVVLRIETSRPSGRYTRPIVSWQVVDVDAGLNERNYPKRIVASCAEEGAAEQIAAHFNGVNPHATHWEAEAELAQRELTDMENRWQGTLDFANVQAGHLRAERDSLKRECGLYHLALDMLRDQLAEMMADRNSIRNQLFETREQRDAIWAELVRC